MVRLIREPIDHVALTQMVQSPACGAIVTFLGTVREWTGDEHTLALEYEAYEPMAMRKLAEIEEQIRRNWSVAEVALVHRLGRLGVGEVSVAIAIGSPHRAAAFEACQYAIERLKVVVPIWKKDLAASGEGRWIHPEGHP